MKTSIHRRWNVLPQARQSKWQGETLNAYLQWADLTLVLFYRTAYNHSTIFYFVFSFGTFVE